MSRNQTSWGTVRWYARVVRKGRPHRDWHTFYELANWTATGVCQ